ncbi:NAD(P)/FAD-dependent oxidoreductase [Rhodobacter sp. Har01]|uniref:NAD(P)/FAD-dependent oxidoreductase n=1 Tax=Rhodobacter sp. Har01 TaxID=2883999 RepID=UPI001D07FC6E|nr:NAD(P)/FAD-dependent oxidoreductase [Rhodobacter sp. Har01]MCB6180117.1 NAD(P)/FAD-dependent oxidoreductase [Rhodobacter sp. Har01]
MDRIDCVVVGAGVVGLAIAQRLAKLGLDTLILERAPAFGTETSARNSEVIHAGIYYPPGSLKAQLCRRGRDLLYAHLTEHAVPHRRCGKLIVATAPDQTAVLNEIRSRALQCGVTDLRLLDAAEAQRMEPALACTAALLSPVTGIVDSQGFMRSLLGQAEASGAMLSLNTALVAARVSGAGFVLETEDTVTGARFTLAARHLVNSAGLWASDLAGRIDGLAPDRVPATRFARGTYFSLPGRSAFSHLVYPVPEPGGLGVHLTLDLAGAMRFGPDVDWIDSIDYRVNNDRQGHFETEVRKYWPALPPGALEATYCGIRPKLSGPGEAAADFRIDGPDRHGVPGLVNLFGIESPGLTASLAIAEVVANQIVR